MISRYRYTASILAALILLAGCGNDPQRGASLDQIGQIINQIGLPEPGPTAAQIRSGLTPEVRAQFGNAPLKVGTIEKPQLASVLIGVGRNGRVATFTTPDGVSFAFDDGVLVGTRGLGSDLMTADIGPTRRALNAGSGAGVIRIHRYLDGEDQIFVRSFVCDISTGSDGTLVEQCQGSALSFENRYQRRQGGVVIASRQWVSPDRGYLTVEDIRNE